MPFNFGLLALSLLSHLPRNLPINQLHIALIILLVLLVRHEVFLSVLVVASLVGRLGQVHRVLVFQGGIFSPVVVDGALGYPVVFEIQCFSHCLDMAQYGLFNVWVVEKLLFQLGFVFELHDCRSGLRHPPVVRFSNDEPFELGPAIVLIEFFRIFDVFHIRNDRFGIEAVFFGSSEFLLCKLLALDLSGLVLTQEGQISRTGVVSLGRVVSDFGTCAFLLGQL